LHRFTAPVQFLFFTKENSLVGFAELTHDSSFSESADSRVSLDRLLAESGNLSSLARSEMELLMDEEELFLVFDFDESLLCAPPNNLDLNIYEYVGA